MHGSHAFKWGVEIRVNRDSTIFGVNPNGAVKFGGGTAYSPVTDYVGERHARHSCRRSAARFADRIADCDAVFLQRQRAGQALRRSATSSTKPASAAKLTTFIFRTHGRRHRSSPSTTDCATK